MIIKRTEIEVNEVKYKIWDNVGAIGMYERELGDKRKLGEIDEDDFVSMSELLYCLLAKCNKDTFTYTLEEFNDNISTLDLIMMFVNECFEQAGDDTDKKK